MSQLSPAVTPPSSSRTPVWKMLTLKQESIVVDIFMVVVVRGLYIFLIWRLRFDWKLRNIEFKKFLKYIYIKLSSELIYLPKKRY